MKFAWVGWLEAEGRCVTPKAVFGDHAGYTQGLKIALTWWLLGIPLVIGYFALNFRLHRGKVDSL